MAIITATNPPTVRAPTGYTHSMLITGEQRRLIISGQVGVAPDGSVPEYRRRPDSPGIRQSTRGARGEWHERYQSGQDNSVPD